MKDIIGNRIYSGIVYLMLILVCIVIVYPLFSIFGDSLSPVEEMYTRSSILNFPKNPTFDCYKDLLAPGSPIHKAYWVTIYRTVLGTAVNLFLTIITAYALSKGYVPGTKQLMKLFVFAIIFRAGTIPDYILVTKLRLNNTIWALILPLAINIYNMIIMQSFFKSIPAELEEAARIDGYGEVRVLFYVVVPLSGPAIATIGLFYAVYHWNSYLDAVLYISDRIKWPLQLLLREVLLSNSVTELMMDDTGVLPPTPAIIATTIIVTTLPIIIVYPFLQKYFSKGVMVGAVKG